ncbi:MAG: PAS domain S-box protein [Chroococcidiopsidaceae cyanobacterium CP_BM_ER_R8_30]|nr:PAS domain S-box protein [Chroococcidiopsidaceae cyanobacterium CP_BM_ER_R8_30]
MNLSSIGNNITDRKQIEAALYEAELRWHTLLDNIPLAVIGLDRNGKIEYVNAFFLELVGYTQAEVFGKDWFKTFIPQYQKKHAYSSFKEMLLRKFTYYQNLILTKSGEEKKFVWKNLVLRDLQGENISVLSIGEDITERQMLEQRKDESTSVLCHELRTPLTSIHGALSLLASGLLNFQSDKAQRVIKIAEESTERLARLVNDLLELERLESGKLDLLKQPCNAADLMMQAFSMMQVMANQAGITLSISTQAIQFEANPDQIFQVLTNLLSNAIKFSPSNSTIWLTVELLGEPSSGSRDDKHHSSPVADKQQILFKVEDQGCGIPANKMGSIFERFYQIEAADFGKKRGTGLGLAICRSIVQLHGGQIWVESTLGKGSIFYFTLPRRAVKQ